MNVVHVISSEGYYGAENMLLTLAQALASLDCGCVIAVFRDARHPHLEIAEQAEQLGIGVEIVPCSGRWDWKAVRRIRDLMNQYRPDVLHTHGYKADVYGYLAARQGPAALVSTCHNWAGREPVMRAYAWLDRLVLRGFDRVAAVSESVLDVLRKSGIADARCLANGVDLERFNSVSPVLGRKIAGTRFDHIVGFAGRLVPDKGGDVMIQAAKQVIAALPRTGFVFVGDGPARGAWEDLARRLGISENVLFLGRRRDMQQVYASMDVFVLPSRLEAMPMCLLEAMAAGIPVIATRVGGASCLIVPGITGILIEAEDIRGLSNAMLSLLNDPQLAQSIAYQARMRVARHFSAESMAKGYANLYQEVLTCRDLAGL